MYTLVKIEKERRNKDSGHANKQIESWLHQPQGLLLLQPALYSQAATVAQFLSAASTSEWDVRASHSSSSLLFLNRCSQFDPAFFFPIDRVLEWQPYHAGGCPMGGPASTSCLVTKCCFPRKMQSLFLHKTFPIPGEACLQKAISTKLQEKTVKEKCAQLWSPHTQFLAKNQEAHSA